MSDISWIPAPALARELGVNRRTVIRWASGPYFPQPKVFNRRLYFQRSDVEEWKASCGGNAGVSKKLVQENNHVSPKRPSSRPLFQSSQADNS